MPFRPGLFLGRNAFLRFCHDPFLVMRDPEIWREIALYVLATVFAYALGIAATVALH